MSILDKLYDFLNRRSIESAVDAMKEFTVDERISILTESCSIGEMSVAIRLRQEKHEAYKNMIGNWGRNDAHR